MRFEKIVRAHDTRLYRVQSGTAARAQERRFAVVYRNILLRQMPK